MTTFSWTTKAYRNYGGRGNYTAFCIWLQSKLLQLTSRFAEQYINISWIYLMFHLSPSLPEGHAPIKPKLSESSAVKEAAIPQVTCHILFLGQANRTYSQSYCSRTKICMLLMVTSYTVFCFVIDPIQVNKKVSTLCFPTAWSKTVIQEHEIQNTKMEMGIFHANDFIG